MTLFVQCNSCRSSTITEDHQNPDGALACGCCPAEHTHPGVEEKAACRPITITLLPTAATINPA